MTRRFGARESKLGGGFHFDDVVDQAAPVVESFKFHQRG
jgi:hypothetical protein